MNEYASGFSEKDLILAIESNGEEFPLARAGAEEHDDGRVRWVIENCPIDYHNCVVHAGLTPQEADSVILGSLERFRAHRVPGSWHVGPSMRPPDLGERLLAHGFDYGGDDIGMAADLSALREDLHLPEGFIVERVRDERDLAAWTRTLAAGFGEGPAEAEWVGEMYRRIGLGDDVAWRHYLGRLGGEPVATSTLFLAAGVAGIYFVFTVEGARRQGIGAAVTLAAPHDACEVGSRVGVLGSSEMGHPVYRRLGFREYCRIGIYEYRPAPAGR